jgi:type I restriction enzyme S subunit
MVRLGDVVRNVNLVERDPEGAGIDKIVGLDHLEPGNLHIRRWDTPGNGTSFTRKFTPGQTLFGKRRAYQHKVAYAEFEGICSGDILTFESKDKKVLEPELLPFICQTEAFFEYALGTSAGSLSPRTNWGALGEFEFALPPIDEQKRIAEVLWAADSSLEEYARARRELETLENKMVTWFLGDSPHVSLGSLGTWVGGGTPSKLIHCYWTGETPWASPKDMRADDLYDTEDHISEEAVANSSTKVVPVGSVIVAVRTGILKHTFPVAVARSSMAINQDLKALLPDSAFLPEFVAAYLRLQAPSILRACVKSGTTVESVDVDLFKKTTIPLPGKAVQEHFSRENARLRRSSATLSEHVLSIRTLMKSVIGVLEGSRV